MSGGRRRGGAERVRGVHGRVWLAVFPRSGGFFGPVFDRDVVGKPEAGTLDVLPGNLLRHRFEPAMPGIVEEAKDFASLLQASPTRALVNGLLQHPRLPGFDEIPVKPVS